MLFIHLIARSSSHFPSYHTLRSRWELSRAIILPQLQETENEKVGRALKVKPRLRKLFCQRRQPPSQGKTSTPWAGREFNVPPILHKPTPSRQCSLTYIMTPDTHPFPSRRTTTSPVLNKVCNAVVPRTVCPSGIPNIAPLFLGTTLMVYVIHFQMANKTLLFLRYA